MFAHIVAVALVLITAAPVVLVFYVFWKKGIFRSKF